MGNEKRAKEIQDGELEAAGIQPDSPEAEQFLSEQKAKEEEEANENTLHRMGL